ncbi:MAG: ATP-binding protein [Nocardiopsaceae bacterium]|nr:ATP-binding protein [Nocardiopsaceae bacterium]
MTGRRRVGKSRLVQEFCDRSGVPYVIFQATLGLPAAVERSELAAAVGCSTLPGAELVAGLQATNWLQALRALAVAVPDDRPSIVVIDEVPWLSAQDRSFEGALQTAWDRDLSAKPILLILVGSDLSVMDALTSYGRPFFGRAPKMTVNPLHLGDVAAMTGLGAADAIDALLLTGGFPEIVQSWSPGMTRGDFLRQALSSPLSPFLAAGELTVSSEFPGTTSAYAVLRAIGGETRTFTAIAQYAGGEAPMSPGTLTPIIRTLLAKKVLAVDQPLSLKTDNRNKRYRIADPYLRCWLGVLADAVPLIERGRGDLALDLIERAWPSFRGHAVEPVVRESLLRLMPDTNWPQTGEVGGWWNRQNNPEIDIVGADRSPFARRIDFIGSIKWHEGKPFGTSEYNRLARDAIEVPGATHDTPLVAVSRSGFAGNVSPAAAWGPEDLLRAWQRP